MDAPLQLSAAEPDQLDSLTRKLAQPSPGGPQNQIESNVGSENFGTPNSGNSGTSGDSRKS